jgi:hypothetical protein
LLQTIFCDWNLAIEKKAAASEFTAASFLYPASLAEIKAFPQQDAELLFDATEDKPLSPNLAVSASC